METELFVRQKARAICRKFNLDYPQLQDDIARALTDAYEMGLSSGMSDLSVIAQRVEEASASLQRNFRHLLRGV